MKAFKAYDIRGIFPGDWSTSDAYRIGYFLPRLLNTNNILIGRDARLSSDDIFDFLSRGIRDAGADVISLGLASTPMVYWATVHLKLDASVQITASHNPRDHNGLKVSTTGAMPVGYENGLAQIEKWMESDECIPADRPGDISEINLEEEYLSFMRDKIPDLRGLKIAIDCSDGMAGLYIRKLLGDEHIYINEVPDGNFPGHDPNPLNPKNIMQLSETVVMNNCDLGVIYDGDADRVMFVDEKGEFISPDLMIAVLGHKLLAGKQGVRVIQDIRTSKSVAEHLVTLGAEMHTWKVGRAFAVPKLRDLDGLFGGELAGHYYFREFNYSDSGILASLFILDVMADRVRSGNTVSSFMSTIKKYANSGEINFIIEDKQEAIDAVVEGIKKNEKPLVSLDYDGVRLEFTDWWFNLRPSNTEPYLRFIAEARSTDLLKSKIDLIRNLLKPFNQGQ